MPSASAIKAGAAYIEMFVEDSRLARGLKRAQKRLQAFGRQSREIGKRIGAVAAAGGLPMLMGIKAFAGFDDVMRKVKAVTRATEAEFERLNDRAKELGKTTSYTASEVANAMVEMGRAGFKTDEIDDAIGGMLSLAKATDTELPRATEIAGNALRGFGMDAKEMGRVADVLAYGANNSAQTLDDLGESLKLVAPLAVETDTSIEDVVTQLGILANSGIKGTRAGTAVARSMKELSKAANQKALAKLGVQVTDAAGNLRPLADIMEDVGKQTKNMGSAKRLAVFEEVFGRGSIAAAKLARSAGDIDKFLEGIKDAKGYAKKTADEMESGLGGSLRKFFSALESGFINIGDALSEPFQAMVEAATATMQTVSDWIKQNKALIQTLGKAVLIAFAVAGAFLAVGAASSVLAFAVGGVLSAIKLLGAGASLAMLPFKIAIGIFKLLAAVIPMLISPVGLVVAAVVGLGAVLLYVTGAGGKAIEWLGEKFDTLKADALEAFEGIKQALASGNIALAAEILWLALKAQWQKGIHALTALWIGLKQSVLDVWTQATHGMAMIAAEAWANLQTNWVHVTSFLTKAWIKFTDTISKVWNTTQDWLTKKWVDVLGVFDKTIDVDVVKRQIDETAAGRDKTRAQEAKRALADIESSKHERLAGIEQMRKGTRDALSEEAGKEMQERADQYAKDRKASDDALEKAKEDYAFALWEAAAEAEAAAGAAEAEKLLEKIDEAWAEEDKKKKKREKKLADAGATVDAASDRSDVIGTFSAAMLKLMGPDNLAADRTAKATEATAKNTKDIKRKIDDAQAAFT